MALIYNYPDQIGYINNKKGVVSSTVSGETIIYLLQTKSCDTGKKLIIKTFKGTGSLLESNVYVPILPYRLILNDNSFIKKIETKLCQYSNILNFYNPGITTTSSSIIMPDIFTTGQSKFIELNVSRDCFQHFTGDYEYQKFSELKRVVARVKSIQAYDLQACLNIEQSSSTEDILYLSVVSRVDISAIVYDANTVRDMIISYTIPINVLIKINRTSLVTYNILTNDILPYSWTYPIDYDQLDNSIISVGKINLLEDGNISTKMWNYNIIPGRYLSTYTNTIINEYMFEPLLYGCNIDSCYDSTGTIRSVISIGDYFNSVSNLLQNHVISKSILITAGFTMCSEYQSTYKTPEFCSKLSICLYNNLIIYVCNVYKENTKNIYFYISAALQFVINNAYDGDLLFNNNNLYLMYSSNNKRYIFKLSSSTTNLISLFLNHRTNTGESAKNLFVASGATLISETIVPSRSSIYNTIYFNSKGGQTKYIIDQISQDKSMVLDLNTNFIGDNYYLNFNGFNNLLIDKVTYIPTGVSNTTQYYSI